MFHPMRRWFENNAKYARVGLAERNNAYFVTKGSIVQPISYMTIKSYPSLVENWKTLDDDPNRLCYWMVRNGWYKYPVLFLWRLNTSMGYFLLGIKYSWLSLFGKMHSG